jgi:hypothetical protein
MYTFSALNIVVKIAFKARAVVVNQVPESVLFALSPATVIFVATNFNVNSISLFLNMEMALLKIEC